MRDPKNRRCVAHAHLEPRTLQQLHRALLCLRGKECVIFCAFSEGGELADSVSRICGQPDVITKGRGIGVVYE
jgi:hypothetical protein